VSAAPEPTPSLSASSGERTGSHSSQVRLTAATVTDALASLADCYAKFDRQTHAAVIACTALAVQLHLCSPAVCGARDLSSVDAGS
jgi:hypothetical protein